MSFDKRLSQDELTKLANKLTHLYAGMCSSEIPANRQELSPEEKQISESMIKMIAAEDKIEYGELYHEGLRLMLSQPEFENSPRILNVLEILEREDWLRNIPCQKLRRGRANVIIGEENNEIALQDLSLIIGQYGVPEKATGFIGVLGPTRMNYAKTIQPINHISSVLSESIAEYHI